MKTLEVPGRRSGTIRLAILAGQCLALVGVWTMWGSTALGAFPLALVYVLALWAAAAAIALGLYVGFSMAPLPELAAASVRTSANAMWLAPGILLLTTRAPAAVALGLATVMYSVYLVTVNRPPSGGAIAVKRDPGWEPEPLLFRGQPAQPVYLSREMIPAILGALALQVGLCAVAAERLLAASVAFAAVTIVWTRVSLARGATATKVSVKAAYSKQGILLKLLLTASLTALLVGVKAAPPRGGIGAAETAGAEGKAVTKRAGVRLVGRPPARDRVSARKMAAIILRPKPRDDQRTTVVLPGAQFQLPSKTPLDIPFTGEYRIYRMSAKSFPADAIVDTGTPIEDRFETTNGGPMQTVAVQEFEPEIDLTRCDRVMVVLTSGESVPVFVSMELVTKVDREDAGTEILEPATVSETVGFRMPVVRGPREVRAIQLSFMRLSLEDADKNVQVAVERFTLAPVRGASF